jgi:hypothetical protein
MTDSLPASALLFSLAVTTALAVFSQPSGQAAAAFTIDLDTTGGFVGHGRGGVTLDSDGRVRAAHSSRTNRDESNCRAQLAAEDLESLRRAVAAVGRQRWPASFAPPGDNGCCDRFNWLLRLEARDSEGRVHATRTSWFDGNEDRLPNEVATLRDIAVRAMTRALDGCR